MTIELKNISKRFGHTQALDNVNLTISGNKIYGLLGNNGAGKSTMFNIITSRLFADSGELTMDGTPMSDNDTVLNQIYMLGEKNYYPEGMKVKESIKWASIFYPNFDIGRANELANLFQLPIKTKIEKLSTGYQSIFKIVMSLSVNTPVLLLDEPVLGLDAQHRDMFYKLLLEQYSNKPSTIVISTHLIAEAAALIEHCFIIKDGKVIKDAPSSELLEGGYSLSGPTALLDEFLKGREPLSTSNLGGLKTAYLSGEPPAASQLPAGIEMGKLNLQEYFIQLVGGKTNGSTPNREGN